jgi:hypothetical protein
MKAGNVPVPEKANMGKKRTAARTASNRRVIAIARRFPENGMKLLLEHPLNVRDLLQFSESNLVAGIDFGGMKRVATTFVQRDYRHIECDVVLTAPFRPPGASRGSKTILVYMLIEHQSLPEEVMILRVLEYVVQIYKYQEREWLRGHQSLAGIRLSPVLPVVFYTGTRRWDDLGSLSDLVELGELFGPLVPALKPLFINLSGLAAERLVSAGGFFGRLLHVVQQREAPAATFEGLLREEVVALEAMHPRQRARWLELLSYLLALVYHERNPAEHHSLRETVEESVAAGALQREVKAMAKTIAEMFREEGEKKGEKKGEIRTLRRTLLELLEEKFGAVPAAKQALVKATTDPKQLRLWLKRFANAHTLDDVQIGAPSGNE